MSKLLNYEGLTTYDNKIKEWVEGKIADATPAAIEYATNADIAALFAEAPVDDVIDGDAPVDDEI